MSALLTKTGKFSRDIRELMADKHMSPMDAIVHWCEINGHEVEYAASMCKKDPQLLASLQEEAEGLNIIKKQARLPE